VRGTFVGWRPLAAYPPIVSFNQNQADTSIAANPAVYRPQTIPVSSYLNQENTLAEAEPAVYRPQTISSYQNQASSFIAATPAIHRSQNIPSNQNQASTFIVAATPAVYGPQYVPPPWVLEIERSMRQNMRENLRENMSDTVVMNPNNIAAAAPAKREDTAQPSEAERRIRMPMEAVEKWRAAFAAREEAHAASPGPPVVTEGANRAAAISAERENLERTDKAQRRVQAEINAVVAEEKRAAAISAERENDGQAAAVEQRIQTQRDAIERNKAALAARERARTAASNAPDLVADANRDAASSAERENLERTDKAQQRIQAQRDAIERNKAALAAQEHSASSILMADVNRAAATLAAHEEAHAAR